MHSYSYTEFPTGMNEVSIYLKIAFPSFSSVVSVGLLSALVVWGQLGVSGLYEPVWQCDREMFPAFPSLSLAVAGISIPESVQSSR